MAKKCPNIKLYKSSNTLTVNNRWYRDGFRSRGYSNAQAIADIVDNSMEDTVGSKNVSVVIGYKYNTKSKRSFVNEVDIIDDGCGMTTETLCDALSMGANTGKVRGKNIGSYGVGMKDAAVSFAQKLVVLTKTKDSDIISIGVLDISYKYSPDEPIVNEVGYMKKKDFVAETYAESIFESYEHGTLVKCCHTDRFSGSGSLKPKTLANQISSFLSLAHGKLIDKNGVNMTVIGCGMNETHFSEVVSPSNHTCDGCEGRQIIGEGEIDDTGIKYIAYYIPSDFTQEDIELHNPIPRNHESSGLYVYRNDRMVGSGVNFVTKIQKRERKSKYGFQQTNTNSSRPEYIGLRIELFATGDHDILFKMSSTKILGAFNDWSDDLKEKITNELGKYADVVKSIDDKKREKEATNINPEYIRNLIDFINKEKLLNFSDFSALPYGAGQKSDGTQNGQSQANKKQQSTGDKKNECLTDGNAQSPQNTGTKYFNIPNVEFIDMDRDDIFYKIDGNAVIYINRNSVIYNKVWCYVEKEIRQAIVEMMISDMVARIEVGVFTDDFTADLLNKYTEKMNMTMTMLLNKTNATQVLY